jgi:hypothetical protein
MKTLFYSGDLRSAERVLVDVVGEPALLMAGDFRHSKYQYYYANILFKKGKFKEALKEISQQLGISKDKTGWEISVRVLAILCNMELERLTRLRCWWRTCASTWSVIKRKATRSLSAMP